MTNNQDIKNQQKQEYIHEEEVEEQQEEEQELEQDGGAKVIHNYEKVYLEPIINESDTMFKQKFILTNGQDTFTFNNKSKDTK